MNVTSSIWQSLPCYQVFSLSQAFEGQSTESHVINAGDPQGFLNGPILISALY